MRPPRDTPVLMRTSSDCAAKAVPTTSQSTRIAGKPLPRGMHPIEGLTPTRPVCAAGRRIDPVGTERKAGTKPAAHRRCRTTA